MIQSKWMRQKYDKKLAIKNFRTRFFFFKVKVARVFSIKRLIGISFLLLLILMHCLLLAPCRYNGKCLQHEIMASDNIAHELSVLYNMVEADHPGRVNLPWFLYIYFRRDKIFWNLLNTCGLSFSMSRFNIDQLTMINPLIKKPNPNSFPFYKCFEGDMEHIIYVGRGHSLRRRIEHEEMFVEKLKEKTNHLIRYIPSMGSLSLYEQAISFHNAKIIISIHGGQLAFSMFSQPGSTVIELVPCSRSSCSAWTHRAHSQASWQYIHIHGAPAENGLRYPRDSILKWNDEILDKIIEAINIAVA